MVETARKLIYVPLYEMGNPDKAATDKVSIGGCMHETIDRVKQRCVMNAEFVSQLSTDLLRDDVNRSELLKLQCMALLYQSIEKLTAKPDPLY